MVSLKKLLAVTAMGALMATPAFAQTGGGVGARSTGAAPAPGLDNPTGAIPGTLGSTPPGIGGATSTPVPQGGTTPSTTPGSSTIQR
jgi:hypothetical protein